MDDPYGLDLWVEWEGGVVTARCRKTRTKSHWRWVNDDDRRVDFAREDLEEALKKMLFYEAPKEAG